MSRDDRAERSDEPGDSDVDADGDTGTGVDGGSYPIEGPALVTSAALASVPASRLPELLGRVQADLGPRIDAYRRRYERIAADPDREAFLVEPDHWETVAARLNLTARERDAVVRAHEAAVVRVGTSSAKSEEFETALEIRSGVVIGTDKADQRADE
ncbi:hypothetical protein [Halorubrum laminariae]|uniref:DUF8048 domain-containing protein n=1 Tax=Halorubrum laminariae TaxID=1433523 RepID=A0ABD6C4E0_9EURY|nr:hypothetical protein [Halorubrum laminariae]